MRIALFCIMAETTKHTQAALVSLLAERHKTLAKRHKTLAKRHKTLTKRHKTLAKRQDVSERGQVVRNWLKITQG